MKKFNRDERFIIGGEFYIFFLLGVYTLMVGALVPQIRREYSISYELSGFLISASSVGMITMNLIASYSAILFGLKRAYMLQHAFVIIGLVAVTLSGNPILLLLGMTFIGFASGSTANYSNQIVNDITKGDSGYMNLVGVFFAFGACAAPFIMLLFSNAGNWRYANYVVSIAAVAGVLLTLRMRLGKEGIKSNGEKRGDLSFFRRKKYWVTLISLFCYTSIETSVIGWIATFFIEAQNTTAQFASVMTTLLWVSILAGRIICSVIANRTTPARFIFFLSIGVAIFITLFTANISLAVQVAAMLGLGLFMSGTYSTILASAGPIFSEYKLAFGYFFMLAGLGPVIMPTIVGLISERQGIQAGIRILIAAAVVLVFISPLNMNLEKRAEMEK